MTKTLLDGHIKLIKDRKQFCDDKDVDRDLQLLLNYYRKKKEQVEESTDNRVSVICVPAIGSFEGRTEATQKDIDISIKLPYNKCMENGERVVIVITKLDKCKDPDKSYEATKRYMGKAFKHTAEMFPGIFYNAALDDNNNIKDTVYEFVHSGLLIIQEIMQKLKHSKQQNGGGSSDSTIDSQKASVQYEKHKLRNNIICGAIAIIQVCLSLNPIVPFSREILGILAIIGSFNYLYYGKIIEDHQLKMKREQLERERRQFDDHTKLSRARNDEEVNSITKKQKMNWQKSKWPLTRP
eukprot:UN29902